MSEPLKPDSKRFPLPPDEQRCTHVSNGWRCCDVKGHPGGHLYRTSWCRR